MSIQRPAEQIFKSDSTPEPTVEDANSASAQDRGMAEAPPGNSFPGERCRGLVSLINFIEPQVELKVADDELEDLVDGPFAAPKQTVDAY